jgi:hypothetical protein
MDRMSTTHTTATLDELDAKLARFLASGERCDRLQYEVGVEDHGVCRICTLPGVCHEA